LLLWLSELLYFLSLEQKTQINTKTCTIHRGSEICHRKSPFCSVRAVQKRAPRGPSRLPPPHPIFI
jgi:hypothetical protein